MHKPAMRACRTGDCTPALAAPPPAIGLRKERRAITTVEPHELLTISVWSPPEIQTRIQDIGRRKNNPDYFQNPCA
jgi:hypothetical protein